MAIGPDITGTNAADFLFGTDKDETIYGLGGNDIIDGGLGADILYGGDGNDIYYVDNANDQVWEYEDGGIDMVYSSVDFSIEKTMVETLFLTGTAIRAIGNMSGNTLWGNAVGNDLYGNEGIDGLYGDAGNDRLYGGADDDVLAGGKGADLLNGGSGNDTADYASAGRGVTVSLAITTAQETGDGRDRLISIENLVGSKLDDHLTGNDRANILDGNNGNDILDGGAGKDTASFYSAKAGVNVDLVLAGAQDTGQGMDTLISVENLWGSVYGDQLRGNAGGNVLTGDFGNDVLEGRGGNDTLWGGKGADSLRGGKGADRFVFGVGESFATRSSKCDIIDDFSQAQHDRLDFSQFNAQSNVHIPLTFLGTGAFTGHEYELRYEFSGGDTWVFADVDGDAASDLCIHLLGEIALTEADFIF